MASAPALLAAASSVTLRLSAFIFLRWIPGHHFPPLIIGSLLLYISCLYAYPQAFEPEPSINVEKGNGTLDKIGAAHSSTRGGLLGGEIEDPIFNEEEKSFMKIVFLGLPNWKDKEWSYITIGINVLLVLFTIDLVIRAPLLYPTSNLRFSRVGFVGTTSANVLFREPDAAQLPIYAYCTPQGTDEWITVDRIYYLDESTDFTYPVTYSGLRPATSYFYSLSNNLTGSFTTASTGLTIGADSLTFLTSSCIKANFPYNPLSHALTIPGFIHLSSLIQQLPSPASFMLFLGDFIYVDVPLRLGSSIPHYRSEYRRVYASPSWNLPSISSVPWINTLDDHEIANDWAGGNDTDPFPAASDPFIHYHVSVNPPTPPATPAYPQTESVTFFQFTNGPASFFMLDTRRYRTAPEPTSLLQTTSSNLNETHTMLGASQLSALLSYLAQPEPQGVHWKIIASSVPFTKNWRFGGSDSWAGYLHERHQVLSAMHAAETDLGVRVIVLSGDRHEFAAIRFPPSIAAPLDHTDHDPDKEDEIRYSRLPQAGPHEFSVGPLSMFYLPIRTFRQTDHQDVAIKYIPDGNSKVGSVSIQNLEGDGDQKSLLRYSLWVDGKVRWEYSLTSPAPGYRKKGRLEGLFNLDWRAE